MLIMMQVTLMSSHLPASSPRMAAPEPRDCRPTLTACMKKPCNMWKRVWEATFNRLPVRLNYRHIPIGAYIYT